MVLPAFRVTLAPAMRRACASTCALNVRVASVGTLRVDSLIDLAGIRAPRGTLAPSIFGAGAGARAFAVIDAPVSSAKVDSLVDLASQRSLAHLGLKLPQGVGDEHHG